jgi:hypothetical protein
VATRLARDDLKPGMREIVRQGGKPIRVRYRGGLREVEVDSGAVTSIGSEGGPYQPGSPQWFLEVCRTMAPVASEAREIPLGAVTAIRGVTDLVRARELRRRLAAPGRVRRTVLDRHPSWRAMPTTVVVDTNGAVAVVRVEPPAGFRRGAVMTWLVEFSAVVPIGPAAGLDDPSWLAHLAAE